MNSPGIVYKPQSLFRLNMYALFMHLRPFCVEMSEASLHTHIGLDRDAATDAGAGETVAGECAFYKT